jgi:hypothetical protein
MLSDRLDACIVLTRGISTDLYIGAPLPETLGRFSETTVNLLDRGTSPENLGDELFFIRHGRRLLKASIVESVILRDFVYCSPAHASRGLVVGLDVVRWTWCDDDFLLVAFDIVTKCFHSLVPIYFQHFVILVIRDRSGGDLCLFALFIPKFILLASTQGILRNQLFGLTHNWIIQAWVHVVASIVVNIDSFLNIAGLFD